MRGKVAYTDLQRPSPGITPAYAGKSLLKLLHHVGLRDHPRVCGEKAYSLVINGSEWGSPPRMRGKGTKRCSSRRGGRITPAYAGKSKRIAPSSVLFGDHPRVCGEKLRESRGLNRTRGSPPRMRGKVFDADYSILRSGITPAYAGKSYTRTCYAYNVRDHPRVCGEKCGCAARFDACQGSPPRMRGKEWFRDQNIDDPGITPAYAGKRLKRSHRIGHFSCILCLFHSVLHRASASGGSRAGPCAPPCLPAQNAVPV